MPGLLCFWRSGGTNRTATPPRVVVVPRSPRTRVTLPSFLQSRQKNDVNTPGSLDLGFQFPVKEVIPQHLHVDFDPNFDSESVTRFYDSDSDSDYEIEDDAERASLGTFERAAAGRLSSDTYSLTLADTEDSHGDLEIPGRGSLDTVLVHLGTDAAKLLKALESSPDQITQKQKKPRTFNDLPGEIRMIIWGYVESPPRVITVHRSPLRFTTNNPILLRALCVESRLVSGLPPHDLLSVASGPFTLNSSPKLIWFQGFCFDPVKDTFLVPNRMVVYDLLKRVPTIASCIQSLAMMPFPAADHLNAQYRILDLARKLGFLKEIFLCRGIRHGVYNHCEQLRQFLELERSHDIGTHRTFNHGVTWNIPTIGALPTLPAVGTELSFQDEVLQWKIAEAENELVTVTTQQ